LGGDKIQSAQREDRMLMGEGLKGFIRTNKKLFETYRSEEELKFIYLFFC
jgi:hypothetical protein